MFRLAKLAHFIGLAAFLGSILVFIVISNVSSNASLAELVTARKMISAGTDALTLPGMWLVAITGVWMGWRRHGFGQRFVQFKMALMVLMLLNAHLVVSPAVHGALDAATLSLAQGSLLPQYAAAYRQESIFGALNVVLILAAAVIGTWRMGLRPAAG